MDECSADVICVLAISQIDDMPDAKATDPRFMQARALIKMEQPKRALQVIATEHNDRFDLLRAQTYWRAHKFTQAPPVFVCLTGGFDPRGLSDSEAQLLLRRTVALRLAHDPDGIAFLRERFDRGTERTKLGPAFKAVVGRSTENSDDFIELTRQAAELDTFVAFLDALYGKTGRAAAAAAQSS